MDSISRSASQRQPGFAGIDPPLSLELSANANASGFQGGIAVPTTSTAAIPSTLPEGAAAPDQLQMLKMLAQVSTAPPGPDVAMPGAPRIITTQQRIEVPTLMHTTPDIEVMKAPGVAAALSMLPSPLPLDLSGTGMQSHLAAHPGLAHQHNQQILQYGIHQPQMQLHYPVQQHQLQYTGHLQPLQYQGMTQQQMHYAAPQQQQHMHLQYALDEQQQQRQQMLQLMLQQQQRNQQLARQAALRHAEAAAAATAAAQGPASGSLMQLLTEQQDQQHQPQEQVQQVPQQLLGQQAPITAPPAPTSLLQLLTENQEMQPPEQQQQPVAEPVQPAGAAAAAPAPATSAASPEQQQQQKHDDLPQHTPVNPQLEAQQHNQQLEQQHNPAAAAASAAELLVQPGDVREAQPAVPADPAAAAAAVTADVPAQPEAADEATAIPDTDDAHPGSSAAAAADQPLEAAADSMDVDNSADGANPTSSAGGSIDAAAAAGNAKGSKYGAKRAAALKRQGYTNSVPGPTGNGKSNFRGVFWDRKNSRWRAQVGFNNRKIFMGYFGEPAEAARAYDKKVVQLHGALAKTNFPLEDYADDLRAFNQQQQDQQHMMSQQQIVSRPRRVHHRNKYGSESNSDGGGSAAEGEYMDTDASAMGAAGFNAQQGMQGLGMPGHMAAAAAGGGVGAPAGFYGHMGNASHMFMGGYPAPVSHGMAVDPAAAAAAMGAGQGHVDPATAAAAGAGGALHRMLSGSKAAEGTDPAAAAELSADVAAAVAAAAALVGVAAGEQPDPAAAVGDSTVSMKRKRSAGDVADDTVGSAPAAQAPGAATAAATAAADPANPAAAAGALYQGAAGSFTEQLPAMPAAAAAAPNSSAAAAEQWQQAAWMQQQHPASAAPPRTSNGGRRSYSWQSADSDAAAAHQAPGQRQYGSTHRQYSWQSDDLARSIAGGRTPDEVVWLPWLPAPPHLTWQDHMKNLEASLMRKDADKDTQDRDLTARSDRDTNVISASDRSAGVGAGMGPIGGYYRAGTTKTPSKTPQAGMGGYGGSARWHHAKSDDTPGQHRRKPQWQQQQQTGDTDGLSALLAVAAAAEAGDTDNPDAGADALAGLLSIAAAAGAGSTNVPAAAAGTDEPAVVLTKEQEQEWLALTSALAAVLTGSAEPPTPGFREGPAVTAELLAAIRFLAHRGAAAAGAKLQGAAAAEAGDVGLPFEILSTVEQWMLEQFDRPTAAAAVAANKQQQVQGLAYSLDHEVSIAEALACASEAGITLEARQIYLLVLYHVLCKKERQLKQKLQGLGVVAVQQQKEEEAKVLADADQAAAPMEVDPAAAAAAVAPAAPGSDVSQQQQQQQEVAYAAAGDNADMQGPLTPAAAAAAAPHATAQMDPAAAAAMEFPAAAQQQQMRHMPLASSQLANKQFAAPAAATGLCKPVRPSAAAAVPVLPAPADLRKETAGAAAAGDQQKSHTPAATVLNLAVPVGVDAAVDLQGQGAVDPAAAATGADGHAGSPSPAAAGCISRWGSGVV